MKINPCIGHEYNDQMIKVLAVDQEFQKWFELKKCKTIEEGKKLTGANGIITEVALCEKPSWGYTWLIESEEGLKQIKSNFDTSD